MKRPPTEADLKLADEIDNLGVYTRAKRIREYIDAETAALRSALEGRNCDASVLRKLHEGKLAPAINIELIQAEDAADVLLASPTHPPART